MFKYEDFLNLGKNAEFELAQKLKIFTQSNQIQDIAGVDLSLTFTFDVKTAKKIRRSDLAPSYSKTWIEYRNVKGEYGSLCRENLHFFIIETIDGWIVKSRIDGLNLFKHYSKLNDAEFKPLLTLSDECDVQLYQPYQRKGRKDVLMLVELTNVLWPTLMKIPSNVLIP